ncbi:MAG TPA: hypothetical protein VE343_16555 [Streptosporangiaceae bacterium]|nr:hypothetical protein [Streptosporangiaceae bacterium]
METVVRYLLFLLGPLSVNAPERREPAGQRTGRPAGAWRSAGTWQGQRFPGSLPADPAGRPGDGSWPGTGPGGAGSGGGAGAGPGRRRPRISRRVMWAAGLLVAGLVFRRAIASLVLMALSAALHLAGINAQLPSVRFGWPWQSVTAGTSTSTGLGPWVLQKIEGISRPALGEARFTFLFTHKVSKNIGPWPCWYASTFYAVGHASATVALNPGPDWWAPGSGHYRLAVRSRPGGGKPGHVTVAIVLPRPQLPQSVHDITIDNVPSRPIASQHSWTYPGFGCGVVLRPQFPESVLYAQAQSIAFYKARHAPQVTRPLIRTAEAEAARTIRDNFIQPTVNAFGYTLDRFSIRWAAGP